MTEKSIDYSTLFSALAMFGEAKYWPHFLDGSLDFELQLIVFHQEKKRLPTKEEMNSESVSLLVQNIKTNLGNMIQKQINQFTQSERNAIEEKKRIALRNAQETVKKMNSVSSRGTVKEIAAQYNLSISEVRKLKRENRLNELDW